MGCYLRTRMCELVNARIFFLFPFFFFVPSCLDLLSFYRGLGAERVLTLVGGGQGPKATALMVGILGQERAERISTAQSRLDEKRVSGAGGVGGVVLYKATSGR